MTMNLRDKVSIKLMERFPGLMSYLYPSLRASFNCQTHLTSSEIITLFRLAKGKRSILEIGSYLGASACAFGAATEHIGAKIYCIDTWGNDAMSEGSKNTWQQFIENTKQFSSSIVPIKGWSYDVSGHLSGLTKEIDLLFIDGDHGYQGVKCDWEMYKSFLTRGSTVVFHDIGWAEGVQRVVRDDVEPQTVDHSSLPNMWWGTIL
jgi:predicted O-methyltransferase YrrM